jgi:hypothetical protein
MVTASGSHSTAKVTAGVYGKSIVWGALAGLIGSIVMAMYAMIAAATYQHSGFFTPMYHIASTFIAPDTMMTSMQNAMMGHTFTFALGPALLGAVIHIMIGVMYGVMFGVIAALMRLSGALLVIAGLIWGLIVFAVSTWIGLPIAAAIFGGGDPVRNMADMVGYPTFLAEHLMYGAAVGIVLLPARFAKR